MDRQAGRRRQKKVKPDRVDWGQGRGKGRYIEVPGVRVGDWQNNFMTMWSLILSGSLIYFNEEFWILLNLTEENKFKEIVEIQINTVLPQEILLKDLSIIKLL